MPGADFQFHQELNDLLPRGWRGVRFHHDFDRRASVKDVIESLGVPHPEVGKIRLDGLEVGLEEILPDGATVEIFPARGLGGGPPRFILDVHLGRLSRRLRLLGFDTAYDTTWIDPEIARLCAAEDRILLTRDRQLLKRNTVRRGAWVRGTSATEQIREVVERFELRAHAHPWSRCLRCNGEIAQVAKDEIEELLQPKTRRYYDRFFRCRLCLQVYWEGSHAPALRRMLDDLGIV